MSETNLQLPLLKATSPRPGGGPGPEKWPKPAGSTCSGQAEGTGHSKFCAIADIAIRLLLEDGSYRNRIAIEIKGGTDYSNVHNRLGEAEKSHQKATAEGFTQFWTVINVSGVEPSVWKQETLTTNELFDLGQIGDIQRQQHAQFKEYLVSELGM